MRTTPYGKAKDGYGNVPYHRTDYAAKSITAYFNVDLSQLRGYGLGEEAESLLTTLALLKIRLLLDQGLRLRTACDLEVIEDTPMTSRPDGYELPPRQDLESAMPKAIAACASQFADPPVTDVVYVSGN